MCRMFGIVAKDIKDIEDYIFIQFFSLSTYGKIKPYRDEGHLDGWGVAGFLSNDEAVIFHKSKNSVIKETKKYIETIEKLKKSNSKISIIHLRKASVGEIRLENTQPFIYNDWIFAHNGTILEKEKLKLNKFIPKGNTDSEILFYYILENIGNNIKFLPILIDILKYIKINVAHTSLSFILANSEYLVAYREYSRIWSEDGDSALWNKNYYTVFYTKTKNYIIFCSEPLESIFHRWIKLKNSDLFVVDKSLNIVFKRKI
ncbi:MAG: class II glutamine amidotransferase [Elusimicrobiota bacterium]|nr:class II glutamine amidotransferase [Endomicrobiia bacterium]MDW8166790.1 class II glutamine amidotransferase [Elusimicrobiota bacterium]